MQAAAAEAKAKSEAAAEAGLAAGQLKTEVETLAKLLKPAGDSGLPPVLDQIKVAAGLRDGAGRGARRRSRCARRAEAAPVHWRINAAAERDPALPPGVEPLSAHVDGPARADAAALRQIGVVAPSRRRAPAAPAEAGPASGLARGRPVALGRLRRRGARRHRRRQPAGRAQPPGRAGAQEAEPAPRRRDRAQPLRAAAERVIARRRPRSGACASSGARRRASLPQTRDVLTAMERQARETEAKIAAVADAKARTAEALAEAHEQLAETESALQALGGMEALEAELAAAQTETAGLRTQRQREPHRAHHAGARASRPQPSARRPSPRRRERWQTRIAGADQQIATLEGAPVRDAGARSTSWPASRP